MRIFKSKLFIFGLVTVLIIILIGVTYQPESKINRFGNVLGFVVSPFQKFISFSSHKISSTFVYFSDIKTLEKENKDLKTKIYQLENENRDLKKYEGKIKELQDALNLKGQFEQYDFIGANIIAKDLGNWFNIFTIDIGGKNGINTGFPVITGKGLVGRISNSGVNSSKVISIIDMDSTVFGRISKTRDLVRIKGDFVLKEQGFCKMDYIPTDADITVGDTVETSGLGGIYPKGIIIGNVIEIRQSGSELGRYAVVKPAVDFQRLEEVIVLKNNMGEAVVSNNK
jgi:rod shape-determining protein MreC